jgi:hypothetical protein
VLLDAGAVRRGRIAATWQALCGVGSDGQPR